MQNLALRLLTMVPAVSLTCACFHLVGEPAFTVEGTLRVAYSENGVLRSKSVRPFRVAVFGPRSLIRLDRRDTSHIDHYEFGTDGTNSYTATIYSEPRGKMLSAAKRYNPRTGQLEDVDPEHRVTPVNQATLVINPGVVPEHRIEFITPLWLAYSSAFYFPQGKNEARLPPIYPLGETPEARQLFVATATPVLTRWKLDDQSPHLPRQVDILREGRVFVVEGELTSHRAPSWFREHESAYAYRTLTWTNLGDLRIPLSFEVTRENLVSGWQGDGSRSITAKAVFTGSLQTATLGVSVSSFIPQIPEVTRVEENRLAVAPEKVRGITYLTKEGRILPLSEVRTLDAFQWAARQQGRPVHHTRLQVWYGIFVMVVALVPLATLLVRKTIPHAKKHQNH